MISLLMPTEKQFIELIITSPPIVAYLKSERCFTLLCRHVSCGWDKIVPNGIQQTKQTYIYFIISDVKSQPSKCAQFVHFPENFNEKDTHFTLKTSEIRAVHVFSVRRKRNVTYLYTVLRHIRLLKIAWSHYMLNISS